MSKDLRGFWKPQAGDVDQRRIEIARVNKKIKQRRKNKPPREKRKPAPDGFYLSLEWRSLRYLALRNCGGRCMCCGVSAADGARLHVDHVKPMSTHPQLRLALDNLQVLCDDCNLGKGGWDSTDWRHWRSL